MAQSDPCASSCSPSGVGPVRMARWAPEQNAPAERGDVVWMDPGHSKLATGRAWLPSGCLQADSPRSRNSVTSAAASARGIGISSLARTDIAP